MNVAINCDDNVSLMINISRLTTAEEVIHQVISLRTSMSPFLTVEFNQCVMSIDDNTLTPIHLSKESKLLTLLKSSVKKPCEVTVTGFRAKGNEMLRADKHRKYLTELAALEGSLLDEASRSILLLDLANRAQIANVTSIAAEDLGSACEINRIDNSRSISSSNCSSSSSSNSSSSKSHRSFRDFAYKLRGAYFKDAAEYILARKLDPVEPSESLQSRKAKEDLLDTALCTSFPVFIPSAIDFQFQDCQNYQS